MLTLNDLSENARLAAERDIAMIVARHAALDRVRLSHAEVLREYDLIAHGMGELTGPALEVARGQLAILGRMVDAYSEQLAALEGRGA